MLSALLQLHLHYRLNIWLQWIWQIQLQDETRNIFLGYGVAYSRGLTVIVEESHPWQWAVKCVLVIRRDRVLETKRSFSTRHTRFEGKIRSILCYQALLRWSQRLLENANLYMHMINNIILQFLRVTVIVMFTSMFRFEIRANTYFECRYAEMPRSQTYCNSVILRFAW